MTQKVYIFDGGTNGGNITTTTAGAGSDAFNVASASGAPVRQYTTTSPLKGTTSGRITAPTTADTFSFGWNTTFSGVSGTGLTIRFYYKHLADTSANGATIMQTLNSGTSKVTLVLNTSNHLRVSNTGGQIVATDVTLTVGNTYRIEMNIDPGTTTSNGQLSYAVYNGDDTGTPLINLTGGSKLTGLNNGSATLDSVRFGHTGSVGTVDYVIDAIKVNDTNGTTFFGPVVNVAPTVSVTSPVTVAVGGSASLASTESDPDGDTITGTWAYLSGPSTPSPASASSASTTVTISTAGRYVYRRSVSDGALTTTGDVTIRVTTTPVQPDSTISNAGAATAVGAATLDACLADSSDATYVESVNSPVNAVYVVQLAPMTTPSDLTGLKLKIRSKYVSASSGSVKVELLEGASTVRKDFGTQALTSSFADYQLTLDSTSAGTITDWSNLRVRITDNAA